MRPERQFVTERQLSNDVPAQSSFIGRAGLTATSSSSLLFSSSSSASFVIVYKTMKIDHDTNWTGGHQCL